MTSTQKSWLKITAPPGGYRKWHVFILWWTAPRCFTTKQLKRAQSSHWIMIRILTFTQGRVNIEVWRRIIPRQRTRCCHNSSVQCPITAKLLSLDQRPSLNSSMCKYFLTFIAPPTDSPWNRKYFVNPLCIIQPAQNYWPMITILTWSASIY